MILKKINMANYSKFHLFAIAIGLIALLVSLYLIYNKINYPLYVMVFIIIILLSTNIAFFYSTVENNKIY